MKNKLLPIIILIFSIIGLAVSFILMVEKIHLLEDPNLHLGCSINSVINCASVMKSSESSVFGFPNPILGLMFYSGMIGIVLVMITGEVKRKLLYLVLIASFLGVIFSYWLLYTSAFLIKALCPYCLVSCFSATNIFFALIAFLFKDKNPKVFRWFGPFIALWYVVMTILIASEFNFFMPQ